MQRQVLLDKLSEFLMVEQGGLMLYHVAASRSTDPNLKQCFEEFGQQTAHHRAVLVRLIERLHGDPNYVSPIARLAQVKAEKLLESSLVIDGLDQQEVEANDLENLLLAETKNHADWHLLSQLGQQVDDPDLKQALHEAVREVEPQEDRHVTWARETLSQMGLRMLLEAPALRPERWPQFISGPIPPISEVHPAPMSDGAFLPRAHQPAWQESLIVRAVRSG